MSFPTLTLLIALPALTAVFLRDSERKRLESARVRGIAAGALTLTLLLALAVVFGSDQGSGPPAVEFVGGWAGLRAGPRLAVDAIVLPLLPVTVVLAMAGILGTSRRESTARHARAVLATCSGTLLLQCAADLDTFVVGWFASLLPSWFHARANALEDPRERGPLRILTVYLGLASLPLSLAAISLHQRIQAREWVIDLRPRTAFAHRHLTGTVNLGLDGAMATWLGWILPENAPLTLLGESHLHLATAQRELARIGIDRPTAVATGTPEAWAGGEDTLLNTMPTATFADLAAVLTGNSPHNLPAPDAILDVRTAREWRQGHLRDAVHIPLPDLAALLNDPIAGAAEIPDGTIWTHCSSGYRAVAAASLLTRADRHAVAVDDSYTEAASAGLPITRPRQ